MKILITGSMGDCIPPPYGGIIKRVLLHAKEWKNAQAEVYIHIRHKHEKENDLEAKATYFYDYASYPTTLAKIGFVLKNFFRNPRRFLQFVKQDWTYNVTKNLQGLALAARSVYLEQKIIEIKPDVIISETGSSQSALALFIAETHRIPFVLENYAEIQFKQSGNSENIANQWAKLWDRLVNGADLVIPASSHCATGPKTYLKDPSKLHIIYSGINFTIFNLQRTRSKTETRAKFNLPKDTSLVMAVGALRMRKGHDHLFEAILSLPPEKRQNLTIVLCGMGPAEEMKQKAIEIGFPQESLKIFQGLSEEDLAELYSAMDCFCFPSVTPRECMGMAMKEAMAVGLPIVAYNTGGISEAIENGVNGYLVPTGDREALGKATLQILQLSNEERALIGKQNIEKAQRLFDITKTAGQFYSLMQELLAKNA